jgi:class 3 adenylate cyclase/DNA-binding CsgD family transcriptional regulator
MTALPTGTVTVLFTDIEGSTRLLKALGPRYGDLLADHHRLLREAFAAHDGYEMGTAGDAFFVAFRRGRDAALAAVQAQLALEAHPWPDGEVCRVRMGLHTGEPTLGDDGYHGIVMHRGARIAAAAHGGQVLLSSTTAELLQDDLPDGVSLIALGERQLKDIDRPERLSQLVADGLRTEFPSPRTMAPPRRIELVGRDAECDLIDGLLDDARASHSRALAIRGEAGVGKSSLLAYATDQAADFLVLRTVGFESDAELAFSGLLQLCRPLLGRLDELPGHQARALGAALGLAPAEDVDKLTIGVATLALVALAAEDDDVVIAVDDAQWLDSASIDAILFAARRFEADRVATILTVREDGSGFQTTGMEELRLEGLDPEATRALLAAHVELAPAVADRLHELTSGNPLALVELPRVLSESQLGGAEPLEQPLNLGTRVERAFHGRVEALGADAQRALLIASASESDRLDTIVAAVRGAGIDPAALEEAEDAGLVSQVGDSLVFRHPLARSAVYHAAPPSDRRAAHAALANALTDPRDMERRAWQLASAAFGPDEEVAAALELAGDAARERSGYGGASAAYERAARLSPASESRLRRLLAAGEAAWNAGQTPRAIALLEEGLDATDDPVLRGQLLSVRGHVARHVADSARGKEMLVEAAKLLEEAAPFDSVLAWAGAYRCCVLTGDREVGLVCGEALRHLVGDDDAAVDYFASITLGMALGFNARGAEADPLLERANALIEEKGDEVFSRAPRFVSFAGIGCDHLGQPERGRALATWAVGWARERGVYGALPVALLRKGSAEQDVEDWPTAYTTLSDGLIIAAEHRTLSFLRQILQQLAWQEARWGDESLCRAHIEEQRAVAASMGWTALPAGDSRLGMLELGLGRPEAAVVQYEGIFADRGLRLDEEREHVPNLVEAYVRSGRTSDAVKVLDEHSGSIPTSGHTAARFARARGLVADETGFEEPFREALVHHADSVSRFEEARTKLCYGERLRRVGRRRDARDQLRPALETFERLGAAPWAERTRAELRATGERLRGPDQAREELTAQELRIALQAAEGKTNRQIAATMFLSPKTVEFHLGRAYRKLGITSRAELIRHFATRAAPELVRQ